MIAFKLRVSDWKSLCGGTIALFALGRLCVLLASLDGNVSPVWPATGLAFWLLITRGYGMWPAVGAAQVLVNLYSGLPLSVTIGMAAGNVAEALLAAFWWRSIRRHRETELGDYRTLVSCVVVALGAPVTAASIGTFSLHAGGIISAERILNSWVTWWVGDALGALFMLPLLLAGPALLSWIRSAGRREVTRSLLLLLMTGAIAGAAFSLPKMNGLIFAFFPVLLLTSRWIDAPMTNVVACLIAAASIIGTAAGHGPFATGDLNNDLLVMQIFLGSVAVMAQILPTFRSQGSMLPSWVLLLGWLLSAAIFTNLRQNQARGDESAFQALTSNAATDIATRLAIYIDALHSGASLILSIPDLRRHEWNTYVETLNIDQRYPGINGLGVIFPVQPEAREAFLTRVRADGVPDFAIHAVPGTSPAGGQDEFVITYIAPTAANSPAIGLDVGSEAAQRMAAEIARDTGEPQMTSRITLVQDGEKRPGFLLFLPVYRQDASLNTVTERRAALQAWVYAPFLTHNFLQGVLGRRSGIIKLWFFEDGPLIADHLLYSSGEVGPKLPKFKRVRSLRLAGQSFALGWNLGPKFRHTSIATSVWTSMSVAFSSLFLAALVRSLQNFRQRADQLTRERTQELREEINRRERSDRTLREVAGFQLAILESASAAIISTTLDGVIRTFNPAAERMLGYGENEIVGLKQLSSFHDPAEVAAQAAEFSVELGCWVQPGFDVLAVRTRHNLSNQHEWTYLRKDGSEVPVELTITAIRDGQGELVGFLGMAVDISERRKSQRLIIAAQQASEAALHEVERQRDAVGQHAIVSVTDIAGRIQYVNAKFCTLSGYREEQLIGNTHRIISSGQHPPAFWQEYWRTIRAGEIWHGELCNRSREGEIYWVASTVVPFFNRAGVLERFMAINTDITTRKVHEAALLASQQAAESASKAKSEFLAMMSHEIRTPMNAVIGFTELLADGELATEQRNYVEIIRSSGQNLIALINDILDFSKIEAGKLAVERIRFDGIDAVKNVIKILALQADAKGLGLKVDYAPDIARMVLADPSRLGQVLINLVGNAIKFTDHGGITVQLAPGETDSSALRISITDTGIGINPEKQAMLFQEFVQADSSITRKFGGSGLGLAICKRLVELMGGKIGVNSTAGKGSTFWFEIPLSPESSVREASPAAPSLPPVKPSESPTPAPTPTVGNQRVLVADDNRLNQLLMRTFLSKLKCEAVIANNGVEALELFQTQSFDVILMDHQMPVMDGCEASKAIRLWEQQQKRTRRIPIIAITANAMEFGEEFYRAAGMDAYLTKPLLLPQLERALATVRQSTQEDAKETIESDNSPDAAATAVRQPEPALELVR